MKEMKVFDEGVKVGTFFMSQGLGRDHGIIKTLIEKYRSDFEIFGGLSERKLQSTGGRPATEWLLNYDQFIFLMSLLRNSSLIVEATANVIKAGTLVAAFKLIKDFDFGESGQRFVYAAVDGFNRVKIGISNNPVERVKHLNIGNADELKLVFTKSAKGAGYSDEISLHRDCQQFHIRSEWFSSEALEVLK